MTARARSAAQQLDLIPPGAAARRPQTREVQALLVLLADRPTSWGKLTRTAQKRCARECEALGLVARSGFDELHLTEMGRSLHAYLCEHGAQGLRLRALRDQCRANHHKDAEQARAEDAP